MAKFDNTFALYAFDREITHKQDCCIAGVDEAGRGPLAGPVVAAAAVLDLDEPIIGVNDSKKLSEKKREALYAEITEKAVWAVGIASPEEIDKINILHASLLAMQRALDGLQSAWTLALIDGNVLLKTLDTTKQQTIVQGDAKSASIAAASIIAKVTRDRIMMQYHETYPEYGFALHKGYPTELHRKKVLELGICGIHRKSFCESMIRQTRLIFD